MDFLVNYIRYFTVYRWISHFYQGNTRMLDFGCGKGEFVSYLRNKGWNAYGVDPIIKDTAIPQISLDQKIFFNSLNRLQEVIPGAFEAITLNFSLEHCDNPLLILKKLRILLVPGGLIFIRVPNFNHILKNKKFSLFQINISGHRYFFTVESLSKLLKDSGFTVLAIDTRFCITAALTLPCSLFPKLDPMNWIYEKRASVKIIKGLILGILSLSLFPFTISKFRNKEGAVIHAVAKI